MFRQNFHVGQFLRNTRGGDHHILPTPGSPRLERFKFLYTDKTQRSPHVFRQKLSRRAVFAEYMGAPPSLSSHYGI